MATPGVQEPSATRFRGRREAALEALGDGVMVLDAAPVQHVSRDMERPYAPDRDLYYLTGATEPETVAVLVGGKEARYVLFVRERDPGAELWAGPRAGPERSAERFQPDECLATSALPERLPELLRAADRVHFRLGRGGRVEALVLQALARARTRGARDGSGPRGVVDPGEILDELRLVKDDHEVERLRAAARISADGHRAGARSISAGVGEWAVQAAIDGAFRAAGASGPSYETIVGAGSNACVLHYVSNSATIAADDLVLVDAGAEYALYAGDITRTYPASGRFDGARRDVYDLVDAARRAAIASVRPGATIADVHAAAVRTLTEGLVGLGALSGSVDDLVAEEGHKTFFPHQTSHWLGLDVHDPGDYAKRGEARVLRPGMVFTVEPGLYFAPGADGGVPEGLEGLGVRIEDDVLVTEDGCEVLTAGLPTAACEVEALVRGS